MAKRARVDSTASVSQAEHPAWPTSSVKRPTPAPSDIGEAGEEDEACAMRCYLPPHAPLSFKTFECYDSHYQQAHTHRCTGCRRNFPSDHFLNLHIRENHDAIVAAQKARGDKVYVCLVEGCDKLCSTPHKRRLHLVDKHHFPKDYAFFVVNDGIDKRSSLLNLKVKRRADSSTNGGDRENQTSVETVPRLSGTTQPKIGELSDRDIAFDENSSTTLKPSLDTPFQDTISPTIKNNVDGELEEMTQSMSALKFVPQSVRFGRKRGRGLAKR